jgi:sugar lactone lactonase YvrE
MAKTGTPDIKSINALAFGPDGILFIGDSKGAAVFAVDTKDNAVEKATAVEIKNIDQKIAAVLGTEAKILPCRI